MVTAGPAILSTKRVRDADLLLPGQKVIGLPAVMNPSRRKDESENLPAESRPKSSVSKDERNYTIRGIVRKETEGEQVVINDPSNKEGKRASEPLFIADSLGEWLLPESLEHNGLLVKRAKPGISQAWVDQASASGVFGPYETIETSDVMNGSHEQLLGRLRVAAADLCSSLPVDIAEQIRIDVCSIGTVVGELCPASTYLSIKLEVVGENACNRWHLDNYVGRALVSYTGVEGTAYTNDSNVDFWELENCGNNDCIIRDKRKVESVGIGDILFIKGRAYTKGANSLVHKAAKKTYYPDGRIVNRLVLKVDVPLETAPE